MRNATDSLYDSHLERTREHIRLLRERDEATDRAKLLAADLAQLPKWRWLKRRTLARRRDAALAEAQHYIMLFEA